MTKFDDECRKEKKLIPKAATRYHTILFLVSGHPFEVCRTQNFARNGEKGYIHWKDAHGLLWVQIIKHLHCTSDSGIKIAHLYLLCQKNKFQRDGLLHSQQSEFSHRPVGCPEWCVRVCNRFDSSISHERLVGVCLFILAFSQHSRSTTSPKIHNLLLSLEAISIRYSATTNRHSRPFTHNSKPLRKPFHFQKLNFSSMSPSYSTRSSSQHKRSAKAR
jgi:hypothetical protein